MEADGNILKPEMARDAGVSGALTAGEASVGVIGSNGEVLKLLDVGEQKKFLKVTMFPELSGWCLQEEQLKMLESKW